MNYMQAVAGKYSKQQRYSMEINASFHFRLKHSIKTVCHKIRLYAITMNVR